MTIYWRKSSRSGSATDEACVEVAGVIHGVAIRDSRDADGGRLTVSAERFGDLLQRIKRGAFDS
ncbi:DUF397 domain-containing protein [Actinomadura nitritigenes]|uniref:DUF397 domain-containing protein n=1 Tax=Actinomadura nitritigenes TaxID=134602 RepID=UPI003D8CF72E